MQSEFKEDYKQNVYLPMFDGQGMVEPGLTYDQKVQTTENAYQQTRFLNKVASLHNPQDPPASLFSSALGDVIYTKIATCLKDDPPSLKVQALDKLCDILREPTTHSKLVSFDVLGVLFLNLDEEDAECRRLASRALIIFTQSRFGRQTVIESDIMSKLSKGLFDSSKPVRSNTYSILLNIVKSRDGRDQIIQYRICGILVQKTSTEDSANIKAAAMNLLSECINDPAGYEAAITNNLVNTLVQTLAASKSSLVQEAACRCIGYVCVPLSGKNDTVHADTVPVMIQLLSERRPTRVRQQASTAVMLVSVAEAGKIAIIRADGVRVLINCLSDRNTRVVCNALLTIANICEHPSARETPHLEADFVVKKIADFAQHSQDTQVKQAAQQCLDKIQWRP